MAVCIETLVNKPYWVNIWNCSSQENFKVTDCYQLSQILIYFVK